MSNVISTLGKPCTAYVSSGSAVLTAVTWLAIVNSNGYFWTVEHDPGGYWSADKYVCPTNGYYHVTTQMAGQSSGNTYVGVMLNGSAAGNVVKQGNPAGSYSVVTAIIQANAGDAIRVAVYWANSVALSLAATNTVDARSYGLFSYLTVMQVG